MLIRHAELPDLPRIVEIYNTTVPGRMVTADTEPISVESRVVWFHHHNPEHRPLWVMEQNGAIAGWLSFHSFYGRPAYHITAELGIYVAPEFRRQGVGRSLLTQAIQEAPQFGLENLLGFIFGHNEPSLQLFKAFGFQQWGYLPKVAELDGIKRDLVILGRTLETATVAI
jgi:phosphinothricin acetyltransferase